MWQEDALPCLERLESTLPWRRQWPAEADHGLRKAKRVLTCQKGKGGLRPFDYVYLTTDTVMNSTDCGTAKSFTCWHFASGKDKM